MYINIRNCFFSATGYIAHMLHEKLDVAYMAYSVCFLLGLCIVFVSGFIFDIQGIQWVMVLSLCVSIPPYLISEWLHKCFKHTQPDTVVKFSAYLTSNEMLMFRLWYSLL